MMNDFGVPMTDADINMSSNPAKAMLNEQMATTGMENQFNPLALVPIAISLWGGSQSASAAQQQADLYNQAAENQLTYDTDAWEMKKDQLIAQRDYLIQQIQTKANNEGKLAAYKDAVNLQQYNYDLQIRNRQQAANEAQFQRSNEIYANQITLNEQAHVRGREQELAKLDEVKQEAAYDANEAYIESLMAEGAVRARGVSGRSADKLAATTAMNFGRRMSMLNAQMLNAEANTNFALESIGIERSAADLRAYANKMLDPGELPPPIQPLATPVSDYVFPPALEDYDFGPKPIKGATMSASAAATAAWGSTITGIAGLAGNLFKT